MPYFCNILSGVRPKAKQTDVQMTVLITGQPQAGKTSLLYRLKLDDFILNQPTFCPISEKATFITSMGEKRVYHLIDIGRPLHEMAYSPINNSFSSHFLDDSEVALVSGNIRIYPDEISTLPPWLSAYMGLTSKIIYVINGQNSFDSVLQCRGDVEALLFPEQYTYKRPQILILVNKSDLPDALNAVDVSQLLGLPSSLQNHRWKVVDCSVKSGAGIRSALSWLLQTPFPMTSYEKQCSYNLDLELATLQEKPTH